jgi:hypothetical protein
MNDGFVASTAYAGARSCPYCAHFEEDGHGLSCSFAELQRRALNAEAERDAANDSDDLRATVALNAELLAALKECFDPLQDAGCYKLAARVEAIIAKAEGKP